MKDAKEAGLAGDVFSKAVTFVRLAPTSLYTICCFFHHHVDWLPDALALVKDAKEAALAAEFSEKHLLVV